MLRGPKTASVWGGLCAAEVMPGAELEAALPRLLGSPEVAYLHVHNAKPGCFACAVERL